MANICKPSAVLLGLLLIFYLHVIFESYNEIQKLSCLWYIYIFINEIY